MYLLDVEFRAEARSGRVLLGILQLINEIHKFEIMMR
jgi:hypothetical protein